VSEPSDREHVRAHFRRDAEYWRSVYEDDADPAGDVYRLRLERVLDYVERLGIAAPARVVDAGAGAGLASVALAALGHDVLAVDSTTRMLELTQARAQETGVAVELAEADAAQLPVADGSVDLVVALGLLPWLSDPAPVVEEFRRVLRPGGGLVVTADNRWRATELADPSLTPFLSPLRRYVVRPLRERRGRPPAPFQPRRLSAGALERLLRASGLDVVELSTVGYRPITFMRRPLRGPAAQVERLLAAAGSAPLVRLAGVHVVAAARRPG
jgi:SAM-dependent methyltransferase